MGLTYYFPLLSLFPRKRKYFPVQMKGGGKGDGLSCSRSTSGQASRCHAMSGEDGGCGGVAAGRLGWDVEGPLSGFASTAVSWGTLQDPLPPHPTPGLSFLAGKRR